MSSAGSVMVVDDLPGPAERLARSLRRLRYEVFVAFSAADALEAAEARELQLVMVQAQLGQGSGLDLCRRLGWRRPDLVVIAASSSNDPRLAHLVREAGAFDLVVTPVSEGELCYRVERALKRRELVRRLRLVRDLSASWAGAPAVAH